MNSSSPIAVLLPADFSIEEAFSKLRTRPGCLWLDSALRGPMDRRSEPLGRYSFLTCDPIDQLVASPGDDNPWPLLRQWSDRLPKNYDSKLPPFQGGIAGLVGYEAACWLEPIEVAACNDLPTPAISLGLYDWTIAVDHLSGKSWIIAQGWGCNGNDHPQPWVASVKLAQERIEEINAALIAETPSTASQPVGAAELANQNATAFEDIFSNFTQQQFCDSVANIVQRIRQGDSFQVNLAQRLIRIADHSSPDLYRKLRRANPAPFGGYYDGGGFQVLSSSPEGFLKVRGRQVETRPIKGTVRRTGHGDVDLKLSQKLAASDKDRAENMMIVDLMRNDLSRVCTDESVDVVQLCEIEQYEYVQHLVSVVQGLLRPMLGPVDLLEACFPGGSVTGAPKIEAMRTIAQLEKNPRGPYCGSLGYIGCGGQADFNILIRTITATAGYWQIPVGGGITARSDPKVEEYETWSKAKGMLQAIRK